MSAALAGYIACQSIAGTLLDGAILPDDIAAGRHVELGVRSIRPDGRSHYDQTFRWPWPGGWTHRVEADTTDAPCAEGLHIARGWRGLSARAPVHVVQVVAFDPADIAHRSRDSLRVHQAAVLNIVDVWAMIRTGLLRGADLSGAVLIGAELNDANLEGADLNRVNLSGANLTGAKLPYGVFIDDAMWNERTRWPAGATQRPDTPETWMPRNRG